MCQKSRLMKCIIYAVFESMYWHMREVSLKESYDSACPRLICRRNQWMCTQSQYSEMKQAPEYNPVCVFLEYLSI